VQGTDSYTQSEDVLTYGTVIVGPIVALFKFTLFQKLVDRKIWLTLLLLASPCALVLLIRNFALDNPPPLERWEMYHVPVQFLLIMVVTPLVCMVHGVSLIATEVEGQTLVYLITRRMRRATVLIVKFVATALVLVVLSDLAMVALHLCNLAGLDELTRQAITGVHGGWDPSSDLQWYLLMTIPASVVGFLAIFTLVGMVTAKPLSLSIFYIIAGELILSNLPIGARVYSFMHQVRVMSAGHIPNVPYLYDLPVDLLPLYAADKSGIPGFCGIVIVALGLSAVLVTMRELMPSKISRE